MIEMLRTHPVSRTTEWRPDAGIMGADVCMHSGWGPIRLSQTTGSLVTHNMEDLSTHWVTATSAPCTSIFKPVWMDCELPEMGTYPAGTYDPNSLFWKHELVHRAILKDYPQRIKLIKEEQTEIETSFIIEAKKLVQKTKKERETFSAECFKKSDTLEKKWFENLNNLPIRNKNKPLYGSAWKKVNQAAKLPG